MRSGFKNRSRRTGLWLVSGIIAGITSLPVIGFSADSEDSDTPAQELGVVDLPQRRATDHMTTSQLGRWSIRELGSLMENRMNRHVGGTRFDRKFEQYSTNLMNFSRKQRTRPSYLQERDVFINGGLSEATQGLEQALKWSTQDLLLRIRDYTPEGKRPEEMREFLAMLSRVKTFVDDVQQSRTDLPPFTCHPDPRNANTVTNPAYWHTLADARDVVELQRLISISKDASRPEFMDSAVATQNTIVQYANTVEQGRARALGLDRSIRAFWRLLTSYEQERRQDRDLYFRSLSDNMDICGAPNTVLDLPQTQTREVPKDLPVATPENQAPQDSVANDALASAALEIKKTTK